MTAFFICVTMYLLMRKEEDKVAERLLKCYGRNCLITEQKHLKSQLTSYHSKNYCKDCLKIIKYGDEERSRVYMCVKTLFHIPYPTPLMKKQIRNFYEVEGIAYQDMIDTLLLISTKNSVTLDTGRGLGLIPYFLEEMKDEKNSKRSESDVRVSKVTHLNLRKQDLQSREYINSKMYSFEEGES